MLPEHDYVPAPETPAQIYAALLATVESPASRDG